MLGYQLAGEKRGEIEKGMMRWRGWRNRDGEASELANGNRVCPLELGCSLGSLMARWAPLE